MIVYELVMRTITWVCVAAAFVFLVVHASPTRWHNPYEGNEVLAIPTTKTMHTLGDGR